MFKKLFLFLSISLLVFTSCKKEEEVNEPIHYISKLTATVDGEKIQMLEGEFNSENESFHSLYVSGDKLVNIETTLLNTKEFGTNSYFVIGFYKYWDDTTYNVSLEDRINSIQLGTSDLIRANQKVDGVYIHYQDQHDELWYSYLYGDQFNSNFEVISYKSTSENNSRKFFTAIFDVKLFNKFNGDTLIMNNATFSGYIINTEE